MENQKCQIISFPRNARDHWLVIVDEKEENAVKVKFISDVDPGELPYWLVCVYASEACRLPGLIGNALAMLEQRKEVAQ